MPYISCERAIVCSRGSKFDARLPAEGRGDEYVVLSKQLHDVHENSYDRTHLAHVGFHPHIIEGLCRVPKFTDRITSLVAQALQNRKCILVFECSKGRHRSVAAAFLACLLFEHFIGFDAVQIHHLAERNWQDTCRGQCQACSAQPTAETRRIVEGMIDQVLAKLRTAYTDRLQGYLGNLCSITPPQLGNALTHVATQKCEIPHHSRTQSSSQHNSAHTEPMDASYEKLNQPNRSKWTFARRQDEHAASTRTTCRSLVGVIGAGVPWGLLTLYSLSAMFGDLEGGFLCRLIAGIRSYGIDERLAHDCDGMHSPMLESSRQRKLILSKNQLDTPAKTRVESIRINFLSFCTHQRRFLAINADDNPTSKQDSHPDHDEQCSPGISDRAPADPCTGEAQLDSDSPAPGLQSGCMHGHMGLGSIALYKIETGHNSSSLVKTQQKHSTDCLFHSRQVLAFCHLYGPHQQNTILDSESTRTHLYDCHQRDPCIQHGNDYFFADILGSKQRQTKSEVHHADDPESFEVEIATSKNHEFYNVKHLPSDKICNSRNNAEPAYRCAKIFRSIQWFEFFQPFVCNTMTTRPVYRRAGAPEVPPPGRRPGESLADQLRRVAGLAGGSERQRTRSPPRPSMSPTINLPTLPDGHDEPEKIHIATQGIRFLAKGGSGRGEAAAETGSNVKRVLFDMRNIRNPAQDASHRGHTGYYPPLWQDLSTLPLFRQTVVDALIACHDSGSIEITFQCTAGRHRSVAAAMLLERLLWRVFPSCEVTIDHLHERHWSHSTCAANCGQCWWVRNRAPSSELNALLDDLLRDYQQREAYIDVACHQAFYQEPPESEGSKNFKPLFCKDGQDMVVNFDTFETSQDHEQSSEYLEPRRIGTQICEPQYHEKPTFSQVVGRLQQQTIDYHSKNPIEILAPSFGAIAHVCLLCWIIVRIHNPKWSSNSINWYAADISSGQLDECHQGRDGGLPAIGQLSYLWNEARCHFTHSFHHQDFPSSPAYCNGTQNHSTDDSNLQIGLDFEQQKLYSNHYPLRHHDHTRCMGQRTLTSHNIAEFKSIQQFCYAKALLESSLIGGMEWNHVDWQLFQDISPISAHCDEDLSSFCVEPVSCSSSSHAWIGAQPNSPSKADSQQGSPYEATIADTVIDSDSSRISLTQTWTQKSTQPKLQQKRKRSNSSQEFDNSDVPTLQTRHRSSEYSRPQDENEAAHESLDYPTPDDRAERLLHRSICPSQVQDMQPSRTRNSDDWADSVLGFLSGLYQDTLQYSSELHEEGPTRNTDASAFSSLQQFMQEHGPYPGWEYDEYLGGSHNLASHDTTQGNAQLPIAGSGSDDSNDGDSSTQQRLRWQDAWSSDNDPLNHAPSSPFWINRSIDSLGMIRHTSNTEGVPDYEAAATLTPESRRIPTPLRWQWYRSPEDEDDRDEDTQITQQLLESIFDSIYGEDAFLPISPRRENLNAAALQGGGKDDFQPTKTDINKLVQKLKSIQHGYQPKQMRMLLVADSKFMRKIERTTDVKQLQDCVRAAAQRMGLILPTPTQNNDNAQTPAHNHKNSNSSNAGQQNVATVFKHPPAAKAKGKGKGDANTQPKAKGSGKEFDKGKGKGKGTPRQQPTADKNSPQIVDKGKGKGNHSTLPRSFQLDPEGWNVLPLPEFSSTQGGVYMCDKTEQAKRIAELGVGKPFPIGVLSPYSLDIGVKKPEILHVEVIKQIGSISQKITMQAFLHQITHVDAVYDKTAPVVNIQKPPHAKSSVCYLTFTDEGACVQTKIEMQQKQIPAAKMWIQSLIQQCRGLEIMDAWNLQELAFDGNHRTYQISVRVPSEQVEAFLAISGPGKLQTNVPGALRSNLQHLWLKIEGKPMSNDQVQEILDTHKSLHLGAFCIRGTWAIRTLSQNFDELKSKMGRNEEPAYFISNVSPEMEHENMLELLKQ